MDLDDPKLMNEVAMGLMDHSGKSLEDYFTPAQYILMRQYLKDSLGMDMALFAHLKPIALESIMLKNSTGCPDPISYEDTIMKVAQTKKKDILGLETASDQLAVLGSIPVDSVIAELMEGIYSGNRKDDSEYRQLIDAYKRQDIQGLFSLISKSKDFGDGLEEFLDDRNKKWIPRMDDKMKNSSVFFAVGAGHLWGENGVIHLLEQAGYTIRPVR